MRFVLLALVGLTSLGCQPEPSRGASAPASPAVSASSSPTAPAAPSPDPAPSAVAPPPGSSAPPGAADERPPAPSIPVPPAGLARTGSRWPYHAWTRAEAVTLNGDVHHGVGKNGRIPDYYAVREGAVAVSLGERKPITEEQAKEAIAYAAKANFSVFLSQCFDPRHAVVFFDGDVPVASINVCFECEGVQAWPKPEDVAPTKAKPMSPARAEAAWRATVPKWEAYFRGIGFVVKPPRSASADTD